MTFTARQVLTAAQLNDLEIDTLTTTGNVTVGGTLTATIAAAGSDGQIQYNNGGSFGGASALYFDDVNSRVGIGTTTPQTPLGVNGNIDIVGANKSIVFGRQSENGPHGLEVWNSGSLESALYYRTDPNAWSFENSSGTDILTVDIPNIRVGINDSTPSYTLDVGGSGRYTGTLYFGSSAGSRIQPGTNGANDTINLVSDETSVSGQSIVIDADSDLDFRIGPVSTMKMSNRQVYWGYTGNQGLGTANTIVGTNFGIAYAFDESSSGASIGTSWTTILNAYATPVVTGGKRWGTSDSFTCWVLWGFSAYSTNVSTKYTKVLANSSTLDYATSQQYFFYNTTYQHQGWSFFDTITFRQDLGTINFQLQVRSASGSINFDVNDYKWLWVFKI